MALEDAIKSRETTLGDHMQKGLIQWINVLFRDEVLIKVLYWTLPDGRTEIVALREHYSQNGPPLAPRNARRRNLQRRSNCKSSHPRSKIHPKDIARPNREIGTQIIQCITMSRFYKHYWQEKAHSLLSRILHDHPR
jgi:hypothetical protein